MCISVSVKSVAISLDGIRIVSGCGDITAKVWDARSGKELLSLKGHTEDVTSVAISPDGKHIVSGSWDSTVKVWDARSGKDLLTLKGHTGLVTSVAISPDGTRIVSGSQDGTVKMWDARSGNDLLSLKGHSNRVSSVAISPDSTRIFAQEESGKILAWNSVTGQQLPDPPSAMPPGGRQVSTPDGNLRVAIDNGVIRVDRAELKQERQQRKARDRAFLERLAQPDPEYHRQQADQHEQSGDFYAAAFHLRRLLLIEPKKHTRQRLAAIQTKLDAQAKIDSEMLKQPAEMPLAD
jgi:hypothetical protein